MAGWSPDELETLATNDEIRLSSERADGSLRKPVRMWMVRLGDDVFVRSVKGPDGPWFRGLRTTDRARIRSGELERDVTAEDADHDLDDAVDEAYREKYRRYPDAPVRSVLTEQARASTTRLVPRS
jgi:hypothetical protein